VCGCFSYRPCRKYALFDGVRPCGLFEEAKWLVENQRVWGTLMEDCWADRLRMTLRSGVHGMERSTNWGYFGHDMYRHGLPVECVRMVSHVCCRVSFAFDQRNWSPTWPRRGRVLYGPIPCLISYARFSTDRVRDSLRVAIAPAGPLLISIL